MMSVSPFERFIDLVRFDQEITKALYVQSTKEKEIARLQADKLVLRAELEGLKQAVHDAKKIVHEKELEAKKLDVREAELKKKLEDIENAKQYVTFKKELDSLHMQQRSHEDHLISSWNQLEAAERVLTQKTDVLLAKITDLDTQINGIAQVIKQLQGNIEAGKTKRPQLVDQINPDWLEKYTNMHGRVDNPVVELVQGACGGCFYAVPDQDKVRLKNKALLQCNSCYRFMYDPQVLQIKQVDDSKSAIG